MRRFVGGSGILETTPQLKGQRLQVVSTADQSGNEVKILEHRGPDNGKQAFFVAPDNSAESLKLTDFRRESFHHIYFTRRLIDSNAFDDATRIRSRGCSSSFSRCGTADSAAEP
jgi:hypothetical protein